MADHGVLRLRLDVDLRLLAAGILAGTVLTGIAIMIALSARFLDAVPALYFVT